MTDNVGLALRGGIPKSRESFTASKIPPRFLRGMSSSTTWEIPQAQNPFKINWLTGQLRFISQVRFLSDSHIMGSKGKFGMWPVLFFRTNLWHSSGSWLMTGVHYKTGLWFMTSGRGRNCRYAKSTCVKTSQNKFILNRGSIFVSLKPEPMLSWCNRLSCSPKPPDSSLRERSNTWYQ